MLHYLILVGALLGIYGLIISKDIFARIITIIMLIAITMTFFSPKDIIDSIFSVYSMAIALAIVYVITKKKLSTSKRLMILAVTVPIAVLYLFMFQSWPHIMELKLATSISLISFLIICLRNFKAYKNEFGFLVILFFDALTNVIMAIDFM
jgi:glycosyltransferase involved in cell wall biosynthesis